jgi:hypothetical protein
MVELLALVATLDKEVIKYPTAVRTDVESVILAGDDAADVIANTDGCLEFFCVSDLRLNFQNSEP